MNIPFWFTSALESNIGLNIISQYAAGLTLDLHQGLGTARLYRANFKSPLQINRGHLEYAQDKCWEKITSLADLTLQDF
ncbi:MAG: hypothetical protein ACE5HS_21630 [bacterium]